MSYSRQAAQPAGAGSRRSRANRSRRRWGQEAVHGYLFAAPVILGLLIFTAYPIVFTFYLSFTEYKIVDAPTFIGMRNYVEMFSDELFLKSLSATIYYCILAIPLTLVTGFMVAILMNQKVRGISVYRTIWYLPTLVPAAAAAALWRWILNRDFGLLNNLLDVLGIPGPGWLVEPGLTIPALVMIGLWMGLGGTMLVFLAGLQGLPQHLYEAAEIDGAGTIGQFRHITVPMMSPIIFYNLVLGIIGSFQVFTIVYLIYTPTGSGSAGPEDSALMYMVFLYRNAFQYFNVGYAAALSWLLFLVIVGLTLVMFRLQRRWVYYEAERGR
jgi:multiple sugar transport system permease protein